MFRNGLLHECALTVTGVSVLYARQYLTMTAVAVDVLTRYQTFMGIDSAALIDLLGQVDETKYSSASSGNINLTVTKFSIPTQANMRHTSSITVLRSERWYR